MKRSSPASAPKSAAPDVMPDVGVLPSEATSITESIPISLTADEKEILDELRRQLAIAYATGDGYTRRSLFEALTGYDPKSDILRQGAHAYHKAKQLVEQRKEYLALVRSLIAARISTEVAITEAQTKPLRAKLELMKVQDEVQLHEQRRERQTRAARARDAAEPRPARPVRRKSRAKASPATINPIVEAHRQDLDVKTKGRQAEITDYLHKVRRIAADKKMTDSDKAQMIRVTMEVYKRDEDSLPPEVRTILQRVERDEDGRDDS